MKERKACREEARKGGRKEENGRDVRRSREMG